MLVLSRKHGEKVVLPTVDVEITVVEIAGDRVRLGISAPQELPVHRDEVWERIKLEIAGKRPKRVRNNGGEKSLVG